MQICRYVATYVLELLQVQYKLPRFLEVMEALQNPHNSTQPEQSKAYSLTPKPLNSIP